MKAHLDGFLGRTARRLAWIALLVFVGLSLTADAADQPAAGADRSNRFGAWLLPKSFQPRPSLDFHVITEFTAEGRKLAPPSEDKPAYYYLVEPGKYTEMGSNGRGQDTPPDLGQLLRAMEAALARGHYTKAASATRAATIAIVFNYGTFPRFSMEAHDQRQDDMLAQLAYQIEEEERITGRAHIGTELIYNGPTLRNEDRAVAALLPIVLSHKKERDEVLRRAVLIGGDKFAHDFAQALAEEGRSHTEGAAMVGIAGISEAGPFYRFMNANESVMMLVEDSFNGCYFVIASAFDAEAMQKGKRVLLWRTKMTVNSAGISMAESLPELVRTAGPYLGKEMTAAVTLTRTIARHGRVEMGEPRVVGKDPTPTDAAAPGSDRASQP